MKKDNAPAPTAPGGELKRRSQAKEVWRRLKRNKLAMVGMVIVVLLFLLAIFADVIAPYEYSAQNIAERLQMPSAKHLLGTDNMGRDIFTRIIYGGRVSLLCSVLAIILSLVVGGIFGCVAGFFGGRTDAIIMRLMDILMAIPGLLLSVAVSAVLGAGVFTTAVAIAVSGIAPSARLLRGQILTVREREFITAAKATGSSDWRTILKHILPNILSPIIVDISLRVGGNIMMISSLSFIGLGVQAPMPSLGSLANAAREGLQSYPYKLVFPALTICLIVLSLNLLGDGLRDAFDPKLKR